VRALFRAWISEQDAADFVVIDEVGLNVDLMPRYTRAPRGCQHPTQHACQHHTDWVVSAFWNGSLPVAVVTNHANGKFVC